MQSNTSSAFFMPISKTINTMLKGKSAQGRRMKFNCRVKKSVPVPYEVWQRTPNAHEPIISQELWDKAQTHKQAGALDPRLTKQHMSYFSENSSSYRLKIR